MMETMILQQGDELKKADVVEGFFVDDVRGLQLTLALLMDGFDASVQLHVQL